MAYDENLALRVRATIGEFPGLKEKKMFGGIGYLLNGNMACGVLNEYLIVRVGSEAYQQALHQPHTKVFDTTGRPMTGWVMVAPEGYADDESLNAWLQQGLNFAAVLPPK